MRFASALALALLLVASRARADDADELVLKEAEKIQNSFVSLVGKLQKSTVAVINYVPRQQDGKTIDVLAGVGSGVIVSRDGLVFTNVHVIEGHSKIEVVLWDGTTLPAEEHAQVTAFDFAMLKIRGDSFEPAEWAKTSGVHSGQNAIACGNPRALGMGGHPVVTLGIISGKGRLALGKFAYGNAIQTDAEINPGNSGGPLFDVTGRVIGINGKIAATNKGITNIGVGYTIPARQIQNFLPALLAGGEVFPGWSGLVIEERTHPDGGVRVQAVEPGSPAQKAGMKEGDRITSVNGERISGFTEWLNAITMLPGGASLSLNFVRKDKPQLKRFDLGVRTDPGKGR